MNTELKKRISIYDMYQIKQDVLRKHDEMIRIDQEISTALDEINEYTFHDFSSIGRNQGYEEREKIIDRKIWRYLISLYELHKYMLCTEHDKLKKDIEESRTPEFTIENAEGFLLNLKSLAYENVQKLIEKVYEDITQGTYKVGNNWSNEVKKKRNNNGIDKHFILRTNDYHFTFGYYRNDATITDDLEKACYLLAGEELPKTTIKQEMKRNQSKEGKNKFMNISFSQNGNTHYRLNEEIRTKLNFYGAKRGVIGENIKIKIFEKEG